MADRYASLKQGLVGAWIPSVSGSGLLLPDVSGYGNHGTLTNMSPDDWVSSQYGRALDFDGTNDFTDFAFSQAHNPDYVTAVAWVFVTGSGTRRIVTKPRQAGIAQSYSLLILSSGFATWIANTATLEGAGSLVSGSVNLTNAGWTHLAGTWDGTTSRLFVNGTQVNTVTGSGVITYSPTSNLPLQIGRFDGTVGQYFNGQLDDVRLYSRALSESEIKLLASKRGIGLEPRKPKITFTDLGVQKAYSVVRVKETDHANLRQGLVGAWCPSLPNGGSGNTLPDVSGFNNHGVLTNMSADDWVSGQYGRALRINRAATRDQVNFGNVCHQPNDFSISFFVNKITTGSTAYQNLWAVTRWNTGASMGTNEFCCLLTKDSTGTGDEPSFVVDVAGTGYRVESSAGLRLGFFDHVCCVRLADTLLIYVNGINRGITTGVPATAIANNSRNLKLGDSDIASADLSTNAMFDDIRIYSRALSEPEIKLLASRPGIGLRQDRDRNTFYQFPSGNRRRRILTGMP